MEKVKLQIEILKIKLTFFSALTGGVSFLFVNADKLEKFLSLSALYIIFSTMYLYAVIGIFVNLTYLSDKYKEIER